LQPIRPVILYAVADSSLLGSTKQIVRTKTGDTRMISSKLVGSLDSSGLSAVTANSVDICRYCGLPEPSFTSMLVKL